MLPICSESLREQNKTYFDSIQWEELNDLAIPAIPEPYTIENGKPIPYADTIADGDILPSLPQLGVLDYQNISEDLLVFCDTITAAIVAKSIDSALFTTQKAFLPHLGRFMFEHFPDFSHVFYGRPSFKQDGSAIILLRLAVKPVEPVAVSVADKNQESPIRQDTDTAAQNGEPEKMSLLTENTEDTQKGIEEQSDNMSDVPNFFSDDDRPHFIMLELGAVKEDTAWKISYIDFKGAEYADSALKN
nr:hypothetical protein [uncultured Treponema sp.]